MKLCIIESGASWNCENMDLLAPITDTGTTYLLSDGSQVTLWNHDKDDSKTNFIKSLNWATEEERGQFIREQHKLICKGDTVVIARGRKMLGETKVVKGYSRYDVPGTYGKQYTEYLWFTDDTKVNINHCDVVGCNYNDVDRYDGKSYYYRQYAKDINDYHIYVGGRY